MGKKRFILLTIALLAIAGGLTWEVSRTREPKYDGQPLSFWLERYDISHRTETSVQQADHALQAIGTNSMPTLLRKMQARDSRFRRPILALLQKQHVFKIKWNDAREEMWQGCYGFKILGRDASNAVPALVSIYNQNISVWSQLGVIVSLGEIGPPARSAVPLLAEILAQPENAFKWETIEALGSIHASPDLAVPALTRCLKDTNPRFYVPAAASLAKFGPDALAAVPDLVKLATNDDAAVRNASLWALRAIDPKSAGKVQAENRDH